jgi:hypothetical protein
MFRGRDDVEDAERHARDEHADALDKRRNGPFLICGYRCSNIAAHGSG